MMLDVDIIATASLNEGQTHVYHVFSLEDLPLVVPATAYLIEIWTMPEQ